ncbi:hypothetical protein ZIOFF_042252 [Zingiber officinale]|uniref:BHLH domain-containing protein n=1 Tax=Zingiber officinale TaxID=94328 RepID=A0A8J5L6K8_ZINOF|nr:hypothetical protein ZIOFF_042252 [Zingiber officinale]
MAGRASRVRPRKKSSAQHWVVRKLKKLEGMVPGCQGGVGVEELLRRTAEHIVFLELQVAVLSNKKRFAPRHCRTKWEDDRNETSRFCNGRKMEDVTRHVGREGRSGLKKGAVREYSSCGHNTRCKGSERECYSCASSLIRDVHLAHGQLSPPLRPHGIIPCGSTEAGAHSPMHHAVDSRSARGPREFSH